VNSGLVAVLAVMGVYLVFFIPIAWTLWAPERWKEQAEAWREMRLADPWEVGE
jgi:hypothetical protein